MTNTATAQDWIDTDPIAIREDIQRLGVDRAARYSLGLIESAIEDGDDRWEGITEDALRTAFALIPLMARWERDDAGYAITVAGVLYHSLDGDHWIDADTRLAAAPDCAITLVGGPRHGETVA